MEPKQKNKCPYSLRARRLLTWLLGHADGSTSVHLQAAFGYFNSCGEAAEAALKVSRAIRPM